MSIKDGEYDFLGVLTNVFDGKKSKSNGAIRIFDDELYIEERSRLNNKVKNSFSVSLADISLENINRAAFNNIEITLSDRVLLLRTLDSDMLDDFEKKLNLLKNGGCVVNSLETSANINSSDNNFINASNQNIDIPVQIRKYHELYKDNIISEEEFESKKKDLLNM